MTSRSTVTTRALTPRLTENEKISESAMTATTMGGGGCGVTRAHLAKQWPTREGVAINETDQTPININ